MEPDSPAQPPQPPPPPEEPTRPNWGIGLLIGVLSTLSLGGMLVGVLALSFRTGCEERSVPCIANQAMLQKGYLISLVIAVLFGAFMAFGSAWIMPKLRQIMGTGCGIFFLLFLVFTGSFMGLMMGLETIQVMLWG